MGKVWFMPFDDRSKAARDLSQALGVRRIRREGSSFKGSKEHTVINWGCSDVSEEVDKCRVINPSRLVRTASNKLTFFRKVSKQARTPPFTDSLKEVHNWLKKGELVVGRTQTNGRAGTDIVFIEDIPQLVECPLYTMYIKKREEYRVHCAFGNIIDVQRKIARQQDDDGNSIDTSALDFRIRSHRNGFVFSRHNLRTPDDVLDQATLAYKASGLDFGAIDVIWNEKQGQAYVLEINTAPGLEGTTLDNYAQVFGKLL